MFSYIIQYSWALTDFTDPFDQVALSSRELVFGMVCELVVEMSQLLGMVLVYLVLLLIELFTVLCFELQLCLNKQERVYKY